MVVHEIKVNNSIAYLSEKGDLMMLDQTQVESCDKRDIYDLAEKLTREKGKKGFFSLIVHLYHFDYKLDPYSIEKFYFKVAFGFSFNGTLKICAENDPIQELKMKFENAAEKVKELHPTNKLFQPTFVSDEASLYYYTTGKEGNFLLSFQSGEFIIADAEQDIRLKGNDILALILQFFKLAHKKFRLFSLYKEMSYHFNQFYSEEDLSHLNRGLIKKALLERFTNDEIEIHYAKNKNEKIILQGILETNLIKTMNYYLVIDKEKYTITGDKEEAFETYKNYVLENTLKKVNEAKKTM